MFSKSYKQKHSHEQNVNALQINADRMHTTNLSSKRFIRQHCDATSMLKQKVKYKPKQKT